VLESADGEAGSRIPIVGSRASRPPRRHVCLFSLFLVEKRNLRSKVVGLWGYSWGRRPHPVGGRHWGPGSIRGRTTSVAVSSGCGLGESLRGK